MIGSIPGTKNLKVDPAIEILAVNCGLNDSSELFSRELSQQLQDLKENFLDWEDHTPERFMF